MIKALHFSDQSLLFDFAMCNLKADIPLFKEIYFITLLGPWGVFATFCLRKLVH